MKKASIRFYAELNDFIPRKQRHNDIVYRFQRNVSVKDMIESLGPPHPEIDLILANGESVDFSYQVQDGDLLSVYPVFEGLDISPIIRLRPEPLRVARFVLDSHLGRLAAFLRMVGFDTVYDNQVEDIQLALISSEEKRILLTMDRGLLKRKIITHGYCVREIDPRKQIIEVLKRFDLFGSLKPLTRCIRCNGLLEGVEKGTIMDQLPRRTQAYFEMFWRCGECEQIYWKGSHYERMQHFIDVIGQTGDSSS